jgi:RNA polymerase sigma factor (sigma-70 family)
MAMAAGFAAAETGRPDGELVAAARAGDGDACEQLLARHQPWILNIARRMVWRKDDAEDATQEILVKVWKALPGYRGESAFRTWLYRIAANHILGLQRRGWEVASPRRTFDERTRLLADMPDGDLPDPRTVPVPIEILVREAGIGCTMGVLLCLDGRQRLVFILGGILGATDGTGAEIVGVTPANFRQILSRARRDLSQYLKGNCSLVDPGNACKCARKARAFLERGMLESGTLQFTTGYRRRVRDVVEARMDELAEAHDIFQSGIFRDHPFYESPDPVAIARKALAALSPDLRS